MIARGYTLLEMIIVTAVVVSLVALSIPAMQTSLGTGELGDAAKRVRLHLAKARLRAIESGELYQFRYRPGGRRFQIGPGPSQGDREGGLSFVSSSAPLPAAAGDGYGSGGGPKMADQPLEDELPDGTRFDDPQPAHRTPDELPSFDPGSTARLDNQRWSKPIVFYPNGRTSNARIQILGRRDTHVELRLRGITGTVKVGDVMRKAVMREEMVREEEVGEEPLP